MAGKSRYHKGMVMAAAGLAMTGFTNEEIAISLGISSRSLYHYRDQYPEFGKAIAHGRECAVGTVVMSLFKRANGYQYVKTKTKEALDRDGKIVKLTETAVVDVAPDSNSCIFFLVNRDRKNWRRHPDELSPDAAKQLARTVLDDSI